MKRTLSLATAVVAVSSIAIGESSEQTKVITSPQHKQQQSHLRSSATNNNLRRASSTDNNIINNNNKRRLGTLSYCGNNWQTAHDSCIDTCSLDEDCGPGNYCFHYISCTPPSNNNNNGGGMQQNAEPVPAPSLYQPMTASVPSSTTTETKSPNYMPAYIASLPIRPSTPSTPPPFTLPKPTPNTLSNPTSNYCGYGWESAVAECYHACPSGLDTECPGGRTCHSWLSCQQATIDPAIYNVCGNSWSHAASTCSTRCYLGNDDDCPIGQSCFGGVSACEDNTNLPILTAEDVGLIPKSYTIEEIAILLDEEIQKERDEEAMSNPQNWWCGTSYNNMLETCTKRCTTDEECKPNSWSEGYCFKTPGGPTDCKIPGVPAKEALPEGSRWCGSTWNEMLETCSSQCETNDDCTDYGNTCWEAPNTCQYIGVPVKEKSDISTLWCGTNYNDAMTSCHKACPGESDDECPIGLSCFSGSSCTKEGEVEIREGYKCGTSWQHASDTCGKECQSDEDCLSNEECFADVVCASELIDTSGSYCGSSWGDTSSDCSNACTEDEGCPNSQWCFWVDCDLTSEANQFMVSSDSTVMIKEQSAQQFQQPEEVEEVISCNAEVKRCPNGQFVGRAQQLNCEFYPCPAPAPGSSEESSSGGGGTATAQQQDSPVASSLSGAASSSGTDLSDWGSKPLAHVCSSDGAGNCGLCQGDCDSDDDCQDGLECFSRGQGEMTSVPGCISGGDGDKPGMDYCYTPFQPTTTTTSTTTTSTTTTAKQYTPGNLDYSRECTAQEPCGMCEGDCDSTSHCAGGLECYSRGIGSVDLVPGCLGLGIAGMDYCYDPAAPIILEAPPTNPPTKQAYAGCSAEVRFCPGGQVLYQDPQNDCQFPLCPGAASPPNEVSTSTSSPTASPDTSFDVSSSYCGYSVAQVNGNCASAKACPSGKSAHCDGLEICFTDTSCGSSSEESAATTSTSATTTASIETSTATFSEEEICDNLCFDVLPSEFCPTVLNLPNCLSIGIGEVCESDGECATDDSLNNCGTYDIYVKVACGFNTPTQGQIMRDTLSPTPQPSSPPTPPPTLSPATAEPTLSPVLPTTAPTIDAEAEQMSMQSAAATSDSDSTVNDQTADTPITIEQAIANATANAALSSSSQATQPPKQEYESNVAATFTYDRSPGDDMTVDEAIQPPPPDSNEWYGTTTHGDEPIEEDTDNNDHGYSAEGWNFDTYFKHSRNSGQRTTRISITAIIGMLVACMIY